MKGVAIAPSIFGDGEVFKNGTIHIRQITETTGGRYTCTAVNEVNSVEANTYVYVKCK